MIAVDTSFIIAYELHEHVHHDWAARVLSESIQSQEAFCVCPQVLAEFVHVATDSRRLKQPLAMKEATERAQWWAEDSESKLVLPTSVAMTMFFDWMTKHRLGRKRVLDTLMATTYLAHGVTKFATLNTADFEIFQVFQFLAPSV